MNIQPDFEEFLRLLEAHRVDYMVVGGYAVAFHGFPRFTKDIDVFFDSSAANIPSLRNALVAFGFKETDLPDAIFTESGSVLTFGVAPVRIDLLNRIDAVEYQEARGRVVRGRYGSVEVSFIGREDLILNKLSTPRSKDRIDAEELKLQAHESE